MSLAEQIARAKADYDDVYEAGKLAEQQRVYDETWDRLQLDSQGNLSNYYFHAFAGPYWNDETFKPKYDLKMRYCDRLFAYSKITDLQAILDKQGVKMIFNFGNGNALSQAFMSSSITHIGVVDVSTANQCSYMFYDARKLVTIDKVIFKTGVKQYNLNTSFEKCSALENLTIEGNITATINFKDCTKLSRASIESVMVSLWDSATSDNTITFSQVAVNNAFTTEEWETLVATKPNWTITLAA